jgi:7-cyano-7-deazaguanine synthase in queuosine biosynthesis
MVQEPRYEYDFVANAKSADGSPQYWDDKKRISHAFGIELNLRMADLVDVTLAIYTADHKSSRFYSQASTGQRLISIRIGVRQPAIWERPEVKNKLCDLLSWVSEDVWTLGFADRRSGHSSGESNPYLFQSPAALPATVSLFSGGLDSLAGLAFEVAREPRRSFFLVSGYTNDRLSYQQGIQVEEMRRRWRAGKFRGRHPELRHIRVPFGINKLDCGREEKGQRTRALVYLALGAATAAQAGTDTLWVYENGVGALNLPLSKSQLGVDNYRGVHPVTLVMFEELLELTMDRPVRIRDPFLFRTKADLCKALIQGGIGDLVSKTVSCDGFAQRVARRAQCGVCTSCVLRRQSLLAAGLGAHDDLSGYRFDAFSSSSQLGPAQAHGLRVTREQVVRIARCVGGPDAWQRLATEFPELVRVQVLLAKRWGLDRDGISEGIAQMYRAYVREWESVPAAA